MNILLTFAGVRDPFNAEMIQGIHTDGPVLSCLKERSFATIYIFTTPNTLANSRSLQTEIGKRWPDIRTSVIFIDIPDPTDYETLYLQMISECQNIMASHKKDEPHYFIATASGTPQMQTVWFLLSQSGLIPATLLKITPPRFLRPSQKAVSEINLSMESFPRITLPQPETLEIAATYLRKEKLEAERDELVREFSGLQMIGKSLTLTKVMDTVRAAARYDSAVLIQGETGTGKELVAKALHVDSRRAPCPFVAVNCGAFAESLLESELFGHEKGSFTGALAQHKGAFERADGGTLFLDEIGDAPAAVQVKLLRAIEEREIRRIGGQQPFKVDVRLLSATNKDLPELAAERGFREDLLYRINVVTITLPPIATAARGHPAAGRAVHRQGD